MPPDVPVLTALLESAHEHWLRDRRVRVLAECLAPLLPRGSRVLDTGCGDGRLASAIAARRPDVRLTGVDVLVRPGAAIPVQPFDGRTLPFEGDAFDATLCVDVLHHTTEPGALLAELSRVGRHVVLKDHLREGWLAAPTLRLMDRVGNRRHGVSLPFTYLSHREWAQLFAELRLKVERWIPTVPLYLPPVSWVCGRQLHFVALLTRSGGAQVRAREPGPPTRGLCALGWDGAARGVGVPAPRLRSGRAERESKGASDRAGCGAEPHGGKTGT